MKADELAALASDILSVPTAPYHEHFLIEWLRTQAARRKYWRLRQDPFGNLLLRYRRGAPGRPCLVFHAHLDHPGIHILDCLDDRRVQAVFRGGSPTHLLDAKVRIYSNDDPGVHTRARVIDAEDERRDPKLVLRLTGPGRERRRVQRGDFAMFDFPPVRFRNGLLYARNCDDQAAVVALVALLRQLDARQVEGECLVAFTRAEEVGLHGAIAMAHEHELPRRAKVIGLENSSAAAGAPVGKGPVVRVGDRLTVFHPRVTSFLEHVCRDMEARRKRFAWQRKLMDGGGCETSIFAAAGYEAGALCLPLGNYHNIGKRGKPAPEYISFDDLNDLVELLIMCVRRADRYADYADLLPQRLNELYPKISQPLRETRERFKP